jgi:hypothetical protein
MRMFNPPRHPRRRTPLHRLVHGGHFSSSAKRCDDLVAGLMLNNVTQLGISVCVVRISIVRSSSWSVTAHDPISGECWRIKADNPLDAACALSEAVALRTTSHPAAGCLH